MVTPNPYRGKVVDLVNPYMTPHTNQRGGAYFASGTDYAEWWLKRHPGRWALVGEPGMGITTHIVERMGLQCGTRDPGLVYARVPHPKGEPLTQALHRSNFPLMVSLPPIERDPFNWTPAELADAVQCARDNLFPVSDKKAA